EEITVDYDPGTTQDVTLHDGSHIRLKKLRADYDATDKRQAMNLLLEAQQKQEFLTGLIYVEPAKADFLSMLGAKKTLATLPMWAVRPGREALTEIMNGLK